MPRNSGRFRFDGGAGTYFGTGLLAFFITVCTLGICYPFALVLKERWRAKHSYIDGHRLAFTGSAWGLFGNWLKWLALTVITIGIYLFWVLPRIQRWKWEHTDFESPYAVGFDAAAPSGNTASSTMGQQTVGSAPLPSSSSHPKP